MDAEHACMHACTERVTAADDAYQRQYGYYVPS